MAERLTKKDKPILKNQLEDNMSVNESTAIKRLWQYENVMEKYGIESVEELDFRLAFKQNDVFNYKVVTELEQERDAWKRACELACKYLEATPFNEKNDKYVEYLVNYYYQQAKKEGENNDTNN